MKMIIMFLLSLIFTNHCVAKDMFGGNIPKFPLEIRGDSCILDSSLYFQFGFRYMGEKVLGKKVYPDTAYDYYQKFKNIYTKDWEQDSVIPLSGKFTFIKELRDKDETGKTFYYANLIEAEIQEKNIPKFQEPNHIVWPAIILYFNQKPITVWMTDPLGNIHGNKLFLLNDSVYKLLKEHSTPIINK